MRLILTVGAVSALAASARAQCTPAVGKLANQRQFEAAHAEIDRVLKANAKDDAALHCKGWIYEVEDKSNKAVDWLEKAVAINEKNALHHLWLGNAVGSEAQKASKLRQPF